MSRYSLEKHPKKKGQCPSCGQKGVFRYFQNEEGERLDEKYGICDRAAKCGFDYRPSGELFAPKETKAATPIETIRPAEAVAVGLLEKTKDHSSHFHRWAEFELGFSLDLCVSAEHLERWCVATDGDRTVFVHCDGQGRVVNAKWFKYGANGKRDKNSEPYSLRQPPEKDRQRFVFCFYGEHLLRHDDPTRPICVVESEKTAVLASFFYPNFDWLACGSANGITDEKIGVLHNRPIWWIADADGNLPVFKDGMPVMLGNGKQKISEGGRRNSSLRKLKAYGLEHVVIDLFPDRTDGYDLGDALREGLRPDVVAPAPPPAKASAMPADIEDWSIQWKDRWHRAVKFVEEFERREIDLTRHAENWSNTADALATFGEHGRELLHRLARPSKKYEKVVVDTQFDAAVATAACTSPTKFFQIAKHYNISLSGLKEKKSKEEEIRSGLPAGVNAEDYFLHGFYELDNCYYSIKDNVPRMVCGFVIKVLYLVKSKDNPKRIVELTNQFGYKTTLDLPTDSFVSIGAFKKVVESAGNFVFEGNETDLTRLKKKLFREEKVTTEINTLGWHERGQFYAFANGIYNAAWTKTDEYGIVEHGGFNYYLPFQSGINFDDHEAYANEKKFVHKPCTLDFAQWADLLHKVYGDNGMMGLCFFVSALFRDVLFQEHNAFPLLFCFGERQSGKSEFMMSFKYPFGQPQKSLSLENPSTVIGMVRTLANFVNAVVMLDEYKNSIDKKTLGLLKGLWGGDGRTTGVKSNDNQTRVTNPKSAVILAGQDMPTVDNALFTRCILLEFRSKGRDYESYTALKTLEKQGLTGITLEVLTQRPLLTQDYMVAYKTVHQNLKDSVKGEGIEDRMLQNMAQLLTPSIYFIERELLRYPITTEQLYEMAIALIRRQHAQINQTTDSRRFWDVFVGLATHKPMPLVQEGVDYSFRKGQLVIRLGNVHPPYMSAHRSQYNVPGLDKQTLDYYLKHDPAFVEIKQLRFDVPAHLNNGVATRTSPTTAYCFDYAKLQLDLPMILQDVDGV
jgi:hypothetical protein